MTKALSWLLPLWFLGPASAAQAPARATISETCAPWDGPAFEITIPLDATTSATIVTVAIWKAANISRSTTFRFPDSTQTLGAAWMLTHAGKHEDLTGWITLASVQADQPISGSMVFTSRSGRRISRTFRAEWRNRRAICGDVVTATDSTTTEGSATEPPRGPRRLVSVLVRPQSARQRGQTPLPSCPHRRTSVTGPRSCTIVQ